MFRPFNREWLSTPMLSPCRGHGPFRGLSLMIVFGAGASSCAAKYEGFVFSRNIEVTLTTVPAGTTTGSADRAGPDPYASTLTSLCPIRSRCRRSRCNVGRRRSCERPRPSPFWPRHASSAELPKPSTPTNAASGVAGRLRPRTSRFEQPVTPFGDATIVILLARLLPSRCQPEVCSDNLG